MKIVIVVDLEETEVAQPAEPAGPDRWERAANKQREDYRRELTKESSLGKR